MYAFSVTRSCLILRPHGLQPTRLLCPSHSLGKNTAVGSHSLFQEIFSTQGSNLGLLHYRQILLTFEPPGKPNYIYIYICNLHVYDFYRSFPGGTVVKNPLANAGDTRDISLIPGSRRSPGVRKWQPTSVFVSGKFQNRGVWQATVHGVTKSWTLQSMRLPLLEFVWWITCGSIAGFCWSFLFWGIRLKKQLLLRIYSYNIRKKNQESIQNLPP